ncbi:MAG: glycosyltransferase family 39 protein [Hyphomicrobiales bacterium]
MTRFFNSLTPGQSIGLLASVQIIVLVALPYAFSSAPPIDVVEGLVWAPHWLIGTYKHPPLPSWIIELSVLITRDVILGPFLASQISVAITYGLVFLLGRLLMDPVRAAAGTALIAASYYFTVPTIEFNHNVIQLPLWAGTIFIYALLRQTPTSWSKWILIGFISGLGFYAKYSYALLIGVLLICNLVEPSMRRVWLSRGPYLAIGTALIVIAPHAIWLLRHNFEPFFYLADRAGSPTASEPLWFLGAQFADHLPMIVPLIFVGLLTLKQSEKISTDKADKIFLRIVTLLPVTFTVIFALISNNRVKDMWGMPMFTSLGLLIVMETGREWSITMARRAILGSSCLILLVGVGFVLHSYFIFGGNTPRTNWPMSALSNEAHALWNGSANSPLSIIGGTPWIAGLAAVETPLRHNVIIGETLDHSPWISADDVKTKGALFLFSGARDIAPSLCKGRVVKDILKTQIPDDQPITAFICLPSS